MKSAKSAEALVRLDKLVASLGYCSRSEVAKLLKQGRILVEGQDKVKPDLKVSRNLVRVDGEPLDPPHGVVVAMNKPPGYVCSRSSLEGGSVLELLPERFTRRNPPLVPVGRLDKDTTGLLFLSDDGDFIHSMTSPRHEVEKVYRVVLEKPLSGGESALFSSGTLLLEGESKPLKPASLKVIDSHHVEIAISEGRYHQIKRMFAAVNNNVLELERISIGSFRLDDLEQGGYRLLSELEKISLQS